MSENLLHQIRDDLAMGGSFSDSLRKVMILGTRLRSEDLKHWVKNELNGYTSIEDLPAYRILACRSFMDYQALGYGSLHLLSRVPINFDIEYMRVAEILGGVGTLEDIIKKGNQDARSVLQLDWPSSPFQVLSAEIAKQGGQLTRAWKEVSISDVTQIIESAKNRLLEFVLELENEAENSGSRLKELNQAQITNIFHSIIMDNAEISVQGVEKMTVFDQRGQKVNYQYNAAGNINFGSVHNKFEVIEELQKVQDELSLAIKAGELDEDTATDVDYQMKKAVQQAKKNEPNKKKILEHLNNVKSLIGGIVTLAGLVKGISEAIQSVQTFFA